MFKKSLLSTSLAALLVCVLIMSWGIQSQTINVPITQNEVIQQEREQIPEYVPYMFLFRHLRNLDKQAEKHNRKGKDASKFHSRFKKVLAIDEDQYEVINKIAISCDAEVADLDKKAQVIIEEFRSLYPEGDVPEGVVIPSPPAELIALQGERNKAILRARERVKNALGEHEFTRFDEILKLRLTPNIERHNRPH